MTQENECKLSRFWLKVDVVVLPCTLCNLASISHISLISTLNCNPLEPLDLWLLKLQIHIGLALRNYWEVVPILSLIWHHYAIMDLKIKTSKNPSFFFNHHRISKRTFKVLYFLLGSHRWMEKNKIYTIIKIPMLL